MHLKKKGNHGNFPFSLRRGAGKPPVYAFAHEGMEARFELFPLRRIVEDPGCDPFALVGVGNDFVDDVVRIEYFETAP